MNSFDENLSLIVMCIGTSLARPPAGSYRDEAATTENALDSKKTTDLSISSATCPPNPDHQLSQSYSLNRPNNVEKLFHLLVPGQFGLIKTFDRLFQRPARSPIVVFKTARKKF
ncbi:hypothetical protein P692DRAFT_20724847 [Suillus brevipes Sb2]|nr:hypothetical protein P692DRAFT_20724847 [Suillus brevipes Sb2]